MIMPVPVKKPGMVLFAKWCSMRSDVYNGGNFAKRCHKLVALVLLAVDMSDMVL